MSEERGSGRRPRQQARSLKSFAELHQELRLTGADLDLLLRFGNVFWIPDEVTGLGDVGTEHPWIVVRPYTRGDPTVVACLRTSQVERNAGNGLVTPAGVLLGLDRDGVVLVGFGAH